MLPSSFSQFGTGKNQPTSLRLTISPWYLPVKKTLVIHIQTPKSNWPGTPTAVQRKKSSKSHPLQDEPWPQMIFFFRSAASMKNIWKTPTPNWVFPMYLLSFFRRSRIPGVWGLRIRSTRLRKKTAWANISYIYIYLAGKSQRISISKVCKPYVSWRRHTNRNRYRCFTHFFQVKSLSFKKLKSPKGSVQPNRGAIFWPTQTSELSGWLRFAWDGWKKIWNIY